MQKFKVVASKSQKKYTLIISGETSEQAKEKLHKEGYSILNFSEIDSEEVTGKKFVFEVEKDGEMKNGVILGEDIFKIYVKLRKELGYNILALFPFEEKETISLAEKDEILQKLKIGYERHFKDEYSLQDKLKKEEEFFLKKKIEESYQLLEKATKKMEFILVHPEKYEVSPEKLQKLQMIYEKILQFKKTTNIAKLQEIGELALIKIGEIELESLDKNKNKETRKLLSETNTLLRKIGSTQHFTESNKDLKKMLLHFLSFVQEKRNKKAVDTEIERRKKEMGEIDKNSYDYLNTILRIEKYQEKEKQIQKELLQGYFKISKENREKLNVKLQVIRQNIALLKAKKEGGIGSYTKIKKGLLKWQETIQGISRELSSQIYFFYMCFLFFFLIFLQFQTESSFPFPKIFLLFQAVYLAILGIRGFISLIFSIVFLISFYIMFQINF